MDCPVRLYRRAKKWELIRLSPDLKRMNNCRTGGNAPFSFAVVHGGLNAAGEMAAVAREISLSQGVIEPFQNEPYSFL